MIHANWTGAGYVKTLSSFILLFLTFYGLDSIDAQTFNGQGGLLIPPGAPAQTVGITTSIATVSGVGIIGTGCVTIDNVTIDLTHTFVGDIAIFVIAPSGQVLELSSSNGGAGDNFTNSVFKDNTPLFVTSGTPPYTGTWRPEGRQQSTVPPFPNGPPLGTFTFANTFNGVNADGDWTLLINDYVAIDVGVLNSWSITFSQGGGSGVTVDLGPDITICPGQSVTLTPTVTPTPDSYAWSTGQSSPTITVNPSVTTSYYVTVTDDGCTDADTINVIVNPNGITANAGGDVSICQGEGTTLTGSGGGPNATYQWSSGQNGQNISVAPNGTTVYTLTVTDGACSSTDQVVVTVNPNPIADAGPPQTICEGESTQLSATGGTNNNQYTWSTGQGGAVVTVSPTSTTTYTVTININGCIDTDDVEVTVGPAPDVDAGSTVTICQGEDVTLTATGSGGTYQWSTGASGDEITVSPLVTTIYTVTLTDNGCQATDQVEVEVNNVTANVSPDQTICEGEDIQLTASGGTSYEWSTGQTSATISVSPGATTIYSVTVTSNNCEDVADVEIDVEPVPVAGITDEQTICEGESVTLVATGGSDYEWSSGEGTSTITVSPGNTTIYTVTVTDQGCSSTAEVNVNVNPIPETDAGNDIDICDGELVTLFASGLFGAGEYVWSTGETGDEIEVEPIITTTYTVTATNSFDCAASDDVVVTVHPVPSVNAGTDQSICEGNTVMLTATGGSGTASFDWSSGQSGSSISFEPVATNTYVVTITDGGCTATDEVEVEVLPNPVAGVDPDQTSCAGEQTTIAATGGGNYLWSTGEVTPSISVTPDTTSIYSVTITAPNGCTDFASTTLTIQPLPPADAGPDQIICAGENTVLTGTGGNNILWSTSETTTSITVTPAITTTYSVTVSDASGCSAVDFVTVTVNPMPTANAGPNVFILTGGIANLTATGGGTYLWSTGETTTGISVSPAVTTTYTVTVTLNGCTAVDDVTVFVNEPPAVELGPDLIICEGETITLDATIQGPFNASYLWSTGESTNSISVAPNTTTQYYVTVTDLQSGFFSIDSVLVTVNTTPIGQAIINGNNALCKGDHANYFIDPVPGATAYQWMVSSQGAITSGQGTTSIEVDWTGTGAGQIQLIASNDCGDAPAVTFDFMVDAPPVLLGPINGDINPCEQSTSTNYTISITAGADLYQWTLTGGTIVSGQGTNAITIDWTGSPGGDVCVLATNECGQSQSICATVVTTSTPVISAGIDFEICGLNADLEGSGTGTWSQVSGPGSSSFGDAQSPATSVSVSKPGVYRFLFEINQSGCIASDEVSGEFDPVPVIENVSEDCSQDHLNFTVAFSISSGTSPFTVNGTPVTGTDFISSPIHAGTSYNFLVTDANGCESNSIDGVQDCSCFKNAGEMELTEIDACKDEIIEAIYLGGSNVESGDTLLYLLHDGNIPNGIIAWNDKPKFAFAPPMQTYTTYFISAVVGTKELNGLPDLNDPCLSISEGTPIRFAEIPEVDLGPDVSVSIGDTIDITATSTSSIAKYNWFGSDTCTLCPSITLKPLLSSTVKVEVSNADGCLAEDQLLLTVLSAKGIDFPNVFSPNGDQINDVIFIGDIKSIELVQDFEIFDRWGNNVFLEKDFPPGSPSDGWDGSFDGKEMNPGVYICKMTALMANGSVQNFTWDVTLVR